MFTPSRGQALYRMGLSNAIEIAVVQDVVCWLIRRKARVQTPGQTSERKYEKNISSSETKSLSPDFW